MTGRARYLAEVLPVLYPPPYEVRRSGRAIADCVAEYIVVPNARNPRLLVPARPRRAGAMAVRRTVGRTLRRGVLAAALGTPGVAPMALRDRVRIHGRRDGDSLPTLLRDALGQDVALAVPIGGPLRPNRKPVAHVLTDSGEPLGFVKVGVNDLTRGLVRSERAALRAIAAADLRYVTAPRVRHAGTWGEHEVLVQSPLPVWRRAERLSGDRLALAMREVAQSCGVRDGRLAGSGYWGALRARLDAIGDRPDGRALDAVARELVVRLGDVELTYGAWHGDWSRWNMHPITDTLLVWDWERFTRGVPVGFDALHYFLMAAAGGELEDAADACVRRSAELLAPFDVPRHQAELTALLYLIDIATRYLTDRADGGPRLGAVGDWLLPVLVRRIGKLAAQEVP